MDARHIWRCEGAVPAVDVRADLVREGHRDDDPGAAGDRRASPRSAVHDRRADASGRRPPRRGAVPGVARAGGGPPRSRESRRVRRSLLTVGEIADLLAATDVFVTPYKGQEQVASG